MEKFYLLCLMTRKLFTFAKQECMEENPDSITFQEVLTPGQLYLMFLKVTAACFGIRSTFFALCQYMPETAHALLLWTRRQRVAYLLNDWCCLIKIPGCVSICFLFSLLRPASVSWIVSSRFVNQIIWSCFHVLKCPPSLPTYLFPNVNTMKDVDFMYSISHLLLGMCCCIKKSSSLHLWIKLRDHCKIISFIYFTIYRDVSE